ncbi:MAG: thiamine pyrophosphate-dependent enzyme [Salinivirgaceae bacterium]|jgi:indolepyruvate ferredoxin oxidoreductase alpha subunit|nr:thiamine pyrophosphate-dependent enzyme [Salinivirgaceae bacterium]
MQKVLLGVEAIAQGAIDGGISGVYAYPGTPSTEITEYIQNNKYAIEKKIHCKWSANEKTAMEAALGMSYAGKKALTCMKHVGLNVAADSFMNAAITGVNGGMVVAVADDPSMHSSQNEQDSRYYGKFAQIPTLEPSDQQEAYDMAYYGFQISEKFGVPVLLRITTRLAHSRSVVELNEKLAENNVSLPKNPRQFVLLPNFARIQYQKLIANQKNFIEASNNSKYNRYVDGENKSIGIVACGIAFNYLMENYPDGCPYPIAKISQYPISRKYVKRLSEETDKIVVLEEGYPIIEELLKGILEKENVSGRLDGTLPRIGELTPDSVAKALNLPTKYGWDIPEIIENRLPALCVGCGHHDVYKAMNIAIATYGDGRVFSDIGCYALGALEPYNSINTCVDMGASITMAKGAADAGLIPALSVIGDSTFTHSGITGLLDAVIENTPITIIISDNESTSMTGGQESSAKGKIEDICLALGVEIEHLHVINPVKKNHEELVSMIKKELAYNGVSVIIPRRICVQKNRRDVKLRKVNISNTKKK